MVAGNSLIDMLVAELDRSDSRRKVLGSLSDYFG